MDDFKFTLLLRPFWFAPWDVHNMAAMLVLVKHVDWEGVVQREKRQNATLLTW